MAEPYSTQTAHRGASAHVTDLGKMIRVRASIREVLAANAEPTPMANPLKAAYQVYRMEGRGAIPDSHHEEFDRLFPPTIAAQPRMAGGPLMQDGLNAAAAKSNLAALAGWLDGLVEEAQFEARLAAEAYAQERVKGERRLPKPGF